MIRTLPQINCLRNVEKFVIGAVQPETLERLISSSLYKRNPRWYVELYAPQFKCFKIFEKLISNKAPTHFSVDKSRHNHGSFDSMDLNYLIQMFIYSTNGSMLVVKLYLSPVLIYKKYSIPSFVINRYIHYKILI